ncbi:MAG: hypothetical protein R6U93_04615 [Dehalococcoidia bacterium]
MIGLARLFNLLGIEDEQRLHPRVLERINDLEARILKEIPQLNGQEITVDLDIYLDDKERAEFQECLADMRKWVAGCMDTGDSYHPYAYSSWMTHPMNRVQSLIEKAYRLKAEQAELERKQRECEEKWQLAREAVNPPLSDAEMYLSNEEYDEFIGAARQAILVYTEKGEDYLRDMRSFDYCWCLERIHNRKERERHLIVAKSTAQEFDRRLHEEKVKLQALLAPNKKDAESYFRKQVRDRRYTGQNFSWLLSKQEKHAFDRMLVEISRKKVEALVSADFRPFIASECCRSFFLLPRADYGLVKIPCLGFLFDVFAVVETGVWIGPKQKVFDGYVFDLPLREERGNASITTPDFLGYHYVVLTPEAFGGWSFWQSIPLILLKGLLNGETRPSGSRITSASADDMTYEVEGFEGEVEIPTEFAKYLQSIGSIEGMASIGIITETIADIVKSELAKIGKEQPALAVKGTLKDEDTLKTKAFQLFGRGKKPSDPEVKALGIKPNTAYRYHQTWKKALDHSQS